MIARDHLCAINWYGSPRLLKILIKPSKPIWNRPVSVKYNHLVDQISKRSIDEVLSTLKQTHVPISFRPCSRAKSFTSAREGSSVQGGGDSRLGASCARTRNAAEVIHLKGRGHTLGRRRLWERKREELYLRGEGNVAGRPGRRGVDGCRARSAGLYASPVRVRLSP